MNMSRGNGRNETTYESTQEFLLGWSEPNFNPNTFGPSSIDMPNKFKAKWKVA